MRKEEEWGRGDELGRGKEKFLEDEDEVKRRQGREGGSGKRGSIVIAFHFVLINVLFK